MNLLQSPRYAGWFFGTTHFYTAFYDIVLNCENSAFVIVEKPLNIAVVKNMFRLASGIFLGETNG
jgi:hypothetical protein